MDNELELVVLVEKENYWLVKGQDDVSKTTICQNGTILSVAHTIGALANKSIDAVRIDEEISPPEIYVAYKDEFQNDRRMYLGALIDLEGTKSKLEKLNKLYKN